MDFKDKIQEISKRIPNQKDLIQTEEATKNAFVMPFISALPVYSSITDSITMAL